MSDTTSRPCLTQRNTTGQHGSPPASRSPHPPREAHHVRHAAAVSHAAQPASRSSTAAASRRYSPPHTSGVSAHDLNHFAISTHSGVSDAMHPAKYSGSRSRHFLTA